LEGIVAFTGASDDVNAILRDADGFVLPSLAEGLSNALLEAMAHGLPVVVSDVPGNADVVDHEVNGLQFVAGDADSLADRLARLIADEALRVELGRRARVHVESRYALTDVVERYISLYEGLTSTVHTRRA
jgi:glycosyltransferase involved in cell wall biosynthesis